MNAQVQQQPEVEIVIRVSIPAAEVLLEGLSRLPIDRAYNVYQGLRESIDAALELQRASPQSQAPAQPAPVDNTQQPTKETQPT